MLVRCQCFVQPLSLCFRRSAAFLNNDNFKPFFGSKLQHPMSIAGSKNTLPTDSISATVQYYYIS